MKRIHVAPACLLANSAIGNATVLAVSFATLVENTTMPTHGVDLDTFQRGVRHFTFDIRGETRAVDWTGAEYSIDILSPALGRIWHASDQRIAARDATPDDPTDPLCYVHNLAAPGLNVNATTSLNTRMYDTFFTRPGGDFVLDPAFASPGVPPTPQNPCPPVVVSTDTRIRGLNPSGAEIPLAFFDAVNLPVNGNVLARITFEIEPTAFPHAGHFEVNPTGPRSVLFARLNGRVSAAKDHNGGPSNFEIWWVPEPATLPLMMFGAFFAPLRRRSGE
ncbi:MAG: PEP-CTERM sorting domain-containing protein [Phycisphaerae bacterium]